MGPDPQPVDPRSTPVGTDISNGMEPECRVIHGLHDHTAQTPGMQRRAAVDKDSVGSKKLWFGRVTCPPSSNSGPHHHGDAETAGHMLSGDRVRVYYGKNYEKFIEVRPGDYLFVPAGIQHIEVNMSDSVEAEFVTARSPANIVFNLADGEAPPELQRREPTAE